MRGKGWTKAQELQVGDEVRLLEPGWATVEIVSDTGRLERVYNLEIEDDHTYFVGDTECGQNPLGRWVAEQLSVGDNLRGRVKLAIVEHSQQTTWRQFNFRLQ